MSTKLCIRWSTVLVALLAAATLTAQTRVNLQSQSQDVDFSAAPSTKPAQTGSVPPSTCSIGAVFVSLANAPGKNVYVCTSADTWSQQTGGGAAPDVILAASNVLNIGPNCSMSLPCNVRIGATIFAFLSPMTATLANGTGTAYIYVTSGGLLTVGHNMTLTCTLGCVSQAGITGFPVDSFPISIWTAVNGVWNATGTDMRATAGRDLVVSGTGLNGSSGTGSTTLSLPPQEGGFSVAFRGTDVAAGQTVFVTVPYACTITDWTVTSDGTATIMLWSEQDGSTQLPSDADSLTTNGFALTTGKRIHSTNLTDLNNTQIFAFDTLGVNLLSVGGSASHVEFALGCSR